MSVAPQVLSVNAGHLVPATWKGTGATAIDKHPLDRIEVRDPGPKRGGLGSGVVGDEIGDTRHHGGTLQAVYAYPREDQDWWAERLGRAIPPGGFGENLTTVGVDATHALVGETWTIGEVVLRVEVPRIPCQTFAGHMGERGWVRRFTEAGRTGAYLSVLSPGVIEPGAAIEIERPDHDVDLLLLFRAVIGDLAAARTVVAAGVADAHVRAELEDMIARRSR